MSLNMQDLMGCTQVPDSLAESLCILFEKFCRTGEKPDDSEKGKCSYLEKGGNGELGTYRICQGQPCQSKP